MTSEAAAPQSTGHSVPQCDAALSQAFALLGKRWNGMILGSLMSGPAGFSEIRRALETISDSVLSDRLSEQEAALTALMTGFGVSANVALATVILYRGITFVLPAIYGYFTLRWMRSKGYA